MTSIFNSDQFHSASFHSAPTSFYSIPLCFILLHTSFILLHSALLHSALLHSTPHRSIPFILQYPNIVSKCPHTIPNIKQIQKHNILSQKKKHQPFLISLQKLKQIISKLNSKLVKYTPKCEIVSLHNISKFQKHHFVYFLQTNNHSRERKITHLLNITISIPVVNKICHSMQQVHLTTTTLSDP